MRTERFSRLRALVRAPVRIKASITNSCDKLPPYPADKDWYSGIFTSEPLGGFLLNRLQLPLTVIGGVFAFLYFGVLLIMHGIEGHASPTSFHELFSQPKSMYYYPNLIGISFDLIANPLYFVILLSLRNYLPQQITTLLAQGHIIRRDEHPCLIRLTNNLLGDPRVQRSMPIIVLLGVMALAGFEVWFYQPGSLSERYSIFLSMIGQYAKLMILVQFVSAVVIVNNHAFNLTFTLNHPDGCGGTAAFGGLAIAGYAFLFVFAIQRAISVSVGGSAIDQSLEQAWGSFSFLYLWMVFPFAILLIFEMLIYRPHRYMRQEQVVQLEANSKIWMQYYRKLRGNMAPQPNATDAGNAHILSGDDIETLDNIARLSAYVEQLHTWPISRSRLKVLLAVSNPLLPPLIPLLQEVINTLVV